MDYIGSLYSQIKCFYKNGALKLIRNRGPSLILCFEVPFPIIFYDTNRFLSLMTSTPQISLSYVFFVTD